MVRYWCLILAAAVLAVLGPARSMGAGDNVIRRAAFDIGSTSVKCTVADVDMVTGALVRVVADTARKVDFAEDLARSYDGNLGREVMEQGQAALEELRQEALKLEARQFSAVGGDSFRTARNGRAYFVTLQKKLGFSCRIVSEPQAALLNYHAVRLMVNVPEPSLLVWDIGGNSQRMTVRNPDGSMTFKVDELASISFKNAVIRIIQGRDIATVHTPNPMTERQVREALRYAKAHAGMELPRELAERLRSGGLTVIGIGGVHYHSLPETMGTGPASYTKGQVAEALAGWTGKSDKDFVSEYADTRLTNMILVLAYMEVLGIEKVTPVQCNEAHGLLVSPEYW